MLLSENVYHGKTLALQQQKKKGFHINLTILNSISFN
jgi:hypothetical protein